MSCRTEYARKLLSGAEDYPVVVGLTRCPEVSALTPESLTGGQEPLKPGDEVKTQKVRAVSPVG